VIGPSAATKEGKGRRGLILDFGGVVTTDFHGALGGFCVREGLRPDAIARALRDDPLGREVLAKAERGAITQREFSPILAGLLGVDPEGLFARILADLRPCQKVIDLVADARAAGIATAVLSNSWGPGDVDPYAGYELDDRFDVVVISDRVGLRKPDPAIYQLTVRRLGVQAPRCVFVDDTAHNLPPATAEGMATVLFADPAAGVTEIRTLLNLPA
jgi:epoxide hydrolase-like predicted phosphatase